MRIGVKLGLVAATFAASVACTNENQIKGGEEITGVPNPPQLDVPPATDRYVQVPIPAVDVLWVVDNSCSMSEEQAKLTENFPLFMNYFLDSGLDYHIGVVSTDMTDTTQKGRLIQAGGYKYIDSETPQPVQKFGQMAVLGTAGDIDEKGRAAAYTALELLKNGFNAGFIREEANLSVIVISDEDDYSGNNPVTRVEFIDYLKNLKPSPDLVSFSSIVGPANGCPTAAEPGADYLAVTNQVGGIKWSICADDWAPLLTELGMQAAGLRREFFLAQVPVRSPNTIEVVVEDEGNTLVFHEYEGNGDNDPESAWTYDEARNSITFVDFVPNPKSEVFIEYEILAAAQLADETDDGEAE